MNRTSEFKSAVEKARLRLAQNGGVPEHKQRLLGSGSGGGAGGKQASKRSEFARSAGQIAKEIQGTMGKLEKLAQLAKRKTLFDDRPVEISELTYIIKRDIASLNGQIAKLQGIVQAGQSGGSGSKGKQAEEHNNNILVMLQGKLATTSMGFKDVLEVRTQNMKASKTRTEQFGYTNPSAGAGSNGPASDSVLYQPASTSQQNAYGNGTLARRGSPANLPDYKGKGRSSDDGGSRGGNDFLALDMGGNGSSLGGLESGQQMQMQAQQSNQDQYLGQRASAIESIESTIQELGQIFGQLATMVAQQGETVQRIDADTTDISNNVTGAQRELLQYYASVSGNRALMLKIFGILICFFLLFVLVT